MAYADTKPTIAYFTAFWAKFNRQVMEANGHYRFTFVVTLKQSVSYYASRLVEV